MVYISDFFFDLFKGNEVETKSSVECLGTLTNGEIDFVSPKYPSEDDKSRVCILTVKPSNLHCGIT